MYIAAWQSTFTDFILLAMKPLYCPVVSGQQSCIFQKQQLSNLSQCSILSNNCQYTLHEGSSDYFPLGLARRRNHSCKMSSSMCDSTETRESALFYTSGQTQQLDGPVTGGPSGGEICPCQVENIKHQAWVT